MQKRDLKTINKKSLQDKIKDQQYSIRQKKRNHAIKINIKESKTHTNTKELIEDMSTGRLSNLHLSKQKKLDRSL